MSQLKVAGCYETFLPEHNRSAGASTLDQAQQPGAPVLFDLRAQAAQDVVF